jgi:rod shape determining protein RodA
MARWTNKLPQSSALGRVDWLLVTTAVLLSLLGLVTMNSFTGENIYFERQSIWIFVSLVVMWGVSRIDARLLYRTGVIVGLLLGTVALLVLVLMFGTVVLGAQNRFDLGFFAFQPSDPAQLVLVLVLAKYFARRHMEIGQFKHILISGGYTFLFFFLLFLQPDFGSAVIVFAIWLGMVLIAGISRTHLLAVFLAGAVAASGLWMFGFADYQKERILTFLHPLADIQGAGYNAYQSTIAVGSGGLFGKGIGHGSQSKLEFLPEYETDFIYAAFAEEWGLVGILVLLALFGVLFWRILVHAHHAASNFETLVCSGIALWFLAHIIVHAGMNVGLLPVTGTTIPFLSYGGSHLITEFAALGLILSMARYERSVRREKLDREVEGFEGVG